MNNSSIIRTCIISRKKFEKSKLLRIAKIKDKIFIDEEQKIQGRGVYISKEPKYIQQILKTKILHKAFRVPVSQTVYDELVKTLERCNNV